MMPMIMLITMVMKMMIMVNCFCKHLVNPKAVAFPAGIHLLKVNNGNTRARYEICSKLTKKDTRTMPMVHCCKSSPSQTRTSREKHLHLI